MQTTSTTPPPPTLLRVRRARVEHLFGRYTHDVPLNDQDRVTILHGQNGVGKTVLLRLIAAAFTGRYLEILRTPFDRFELELSDNSTIRLEHLASATASEAMTSSRQLLLRAPPATPQAARAQDDPTPALRVSHRFHDRELNSSVIQLNV